MAKKMKKTKTKKPKTMASLEKEIVVLEKRETKFLGMNEQQANEIAELRKQVELMEKASHEAEVKLFKSEGDTQHFRKLCTQLFAMVGRLIMQLSRYTGVANILEIAPEHPTQEWNIQVRAAMAPEGTEIPGKVFSAPVAAKKD